MYFVMIHNHQFKSSAAQSAATATSEQPPRSVTKEAGGVYIILACIKHREMRAGEYRPCVLCGRECQVMDGYTCIVVKGRIRHMVITEVRMYSISISKMKGNF